MTDQLPPGTVVGARITFGPPNARHEMLVRGDATHCALRAAQMEHGTMQMLAVVAEPERPCDEAPR